MQILYSETIAVNVTLWTDVITEKCTLHIIKSPTSVEITLHQWLRLLVYYPRVRQRSGGGWISAFQKSDESLSFCISEVDVKLNTVEVEGLILKSWTPFRTRQAYKMEKINYRLNTLVRRDIYDSRYRYLPIRKYTFSWEIIIHDWTQSHKLSVAIVTYFRYEITLTVRKDVYLLIMMRVFFFFKHFVCKQFVIYHLLFWWFFHIELFHISLL